MVVLAVLHLLYLLFNQFIVGNYAISKIAIIMAFLYGPLLYGLHAEVLQRTVSFREFLLHSIPFAFFTVMCILSNYLTEVKEIYSNEVLSVYTLQYTCILVSLLCYPVCIKFKRRNEQSDSDFIAIDRLITEISTIVILIAFFLVMQLARQLNTEIYLGFDPDLLICSLLIINIALMMRYLFQMKESSKISGADLPKENSLQESVRYLKSALEESVLKSYKDKLFSYLDESKLYLDPNLSLEDLARETNIPKHHFSQLFNTYIGRSFYQIIAEYRITHAISLLKDERKQVTIESLAYESGFNSKTSFNKYFKEQTGYTPSVYREEKII